MKTPLVSDVLSLWYEMSQTKEYSHEAIEFFRVAFEWGYTEAKKETSNNRNPTKMELATT